MKIEILATSAYGLYYASLRVQRHSGNGSRFATLRIKSAVNRSIYLERAIQIAPVVYDENDREPRSGSRPPRGRSSA